MATIFSLFEGTLTAAAVTGNGTFVIHESSPPYVNTTDKPGMRVVVTYGSPVPQDGQPEPTGYAIQCLVEGKLNTDLWYPIAYQYEPWRNFDEGSQRIILLQPDISTFDTGIDDIVYAGGSTIARISRQQGRASHDIRLRVLLRETKFGTPEAFQSIAMEVKGELFDV